ncbi:hypothetical protein, partial [Streptomyces diastatochromogenes]|uniref:hypothetical protein n=1 Tax=Streptomyces diastatochromogenes TaxID=42236 RepID=UPI0036B9476D
VADLARSYAGVRLAPAALAGVVAATADKDRDLCETEGPWDRPDRSEPHVPPPVFSSATVSVLISRPSVERGRLRQSIFHLVQPNFLVSLGTKASTNRCGFL